MAYCTQADLESEVGIVKLAQMSDRDNLLAGAVNATAVTNAIAEASAQIASYIGHRISINAVASEIPDIVKFMAVAWAIRCLRRGTYNGQPLEDDLDREKTDREWLDGVATGRYSLGVEPELKAAPEITDKASPRDSSMRVSAARLRGYY